MNNEDLQNEIKEWDNALLDLVNKGLIEINKNDSGKECFTLSPKIKDSK